MQNLGRIAPRDRGCASGVALLLEIFEVGVCAKRYLASRHKTHPSCPDLIRASINLRKKFLRRRWITGSSPVTTISNRYEGHCDEQIHAPSFRGDANGSAQSAAR